MQSLGAELRMASKLYNLINQKENVYGQHKGNKALSTTNERKHMYMYGSH